MTNQIQTQPLYSVNEAIKLMGIGRTLFYREIQEGRLQAVKCGRRTLVSASAITLWQESLPVLKTRIGG